LISQLQTFLLVFLENFENFNASLLNSQMNSCFTLEVGFYGTFGFQRIYGSGKFELSSDASVMESIVAKLGALQVKFYALKGILNNPVCNFDLSIDYCRHKRSLSINIPGTQSVFFLLLSFKLSQLLCKVISFSLLM